MCRFGQRKGSLIGRVLDECGSGPKKIVGTVSAISEAKSNAMDCDGVRPSAEAFQQLRQSGEPDAWKLARPVRGWGRGAIPRPTPRVPDVPWCDSG
jgi:hypothetical protein